MPKHCTLLNIVWMPVSNNWGSMSVSLSINSIEDDSVECAYFKISLSVPPQHFDFTKVSHIKMAQEVLQ